MNVTELTEALHTKINSVTDLQEILAITKAIERLSVGSTRTVSSYSGLFALSAVDGEVVFVEDEASLYYGYNVDTNVAWKKINLSLTLTGWSWGNNLYSTLGTGNIIDQSSPVSLVGGFTDWVQLSGNIAHSLGIRANGTTWAWGTGQGGKLGVGDIIDRSSPVSIVGGFTDWVQVSAGFSHSLGLRENGTAWAWGYNPYGKLGDGTIIDKSSPVYVNGGFSDWVQLSAAANHSIGLRENGTAWSWGSNSSGVLGDNTIIDKSSPISVVGGFVDWIQISSKSAHNVGLRANGTAWSWGSNTYGNLGDGTIIDKSSPVSVIGGFTNWVQVSAGVIHSVGIRSNGTAWAWGRNIYGSLGDGTTINRSSPVSVIGGFTNWIQVAPGFAHSIGIRSNGTGWAWGFNSYGQLGDGTVVNRSSPVSIVGGFTDWIQAGAGDGHSLAIRSL